MAVKCTNVWLKGFDADDYLARRFCSFQHSLPAIAGSGLWGFVSPNSALLNGTSQDLRITQGTGTSTKTYTMSFWVKRGSVSTSNNQYIYANDNNYDGIGFHGSGSGLTTDSLFVIFDGSTDYYYSSNRVFRDPSAWYHIVVAVDSTQATSSDRLKVYVNGEQIAMTTYAGGIALNDNFKAGTNGEPIAFGTLLNGGPRLWYSGYFGEIAYVDGQQLTAADFGETLNGHWHPKDLSGLTWGNNGAWLRFQNSGSMGADSSGNGNTFTNTGGVAQTNDSPTDARDGSFGNLAVMSPLHPAGDGASTLAQPTFSNGNRTLTASDTWRGTFGTLPCPTKCYFRVQASSNGASGRLQVGVVSAAEIAASPSLDADPGAASGYWVVAERHEVPDIRKGSAGYTLLSSTAYADGDWVDVWRDGANIWFGKNGTPWSGDPEAGTGAHFTDVADDVYPVIAGFSSTVALADFETASGTFKSVCTANLPKTKQLLSDRFGQVDQPTTEANIDAAVAALRAGWGTAYVDIKINRDAIESRACQFGHDASNEHAWDTTNVYQAKRAMSGSNNWLGMTIRVGAAYGTAAGAQAHTNGADTTVTHNLGIARAVILLFPRSGGEVPMYHPELTAGNLIYLTAQDVQAASTLITNVGANSFDIGSAAATGTYDYLVLAETDFFALGKLTGNALADGPVDYCDGKPVLSIFKDRGSTQGMMLQDVARNGEVNPISYVSFLNTNGVEGGPDAASYGVDTLSVGRKIRTSNAAWNGSGATIIRAAFVQPRPHGAAQLR